MMTESGISTLMSYENSTVLSRKLALKRANWVWLNFMRVSLKITWVLQIISKTNSENKFFKLSDRLIIA